MKNTPIIRPLFLALLLVAIAPTVKAGEGGGPLVAGTLFGGSENEHVTNSARMANGDIVVCGWTDSDDIPVLVPSFKATTSGGQEAFVAVLAPDLKTLKAFTFYGGEHDDKATCVAVDPNGRIILVGETQSSGLALGSGSVSQTYSTEVDGFIAIFDASLTVLHRATYINGNYDEHPTDVSVDGNGSIYICGFTTSSNGFPTNNGYDRSFNGGVDGFVSKIDASLSIVQFSTYFGSENDDFFYDIHLTPDGGVALAGSTSSANYETYPKVNPQQWWTQRNRPYDWTYNGGLTDAVLTVFSQDGAQLVVSTFFGGSGTDVGKAVFSDSRGGLILVGESSSTDLPIIGGLQASTRGGSDVMAGLFVNKGQSLAGSTYFGGSGDERVSRVLRETDDIWIVVGTTSSDDLPSIGAGSTSQLRGRTDGFVVKMGLAVNTFSTTIGWSHDDELTAITVDDRGDLYVSGNSNSPVIALDREELTGIARNDAIIIKWAFGSVNLTAPRGGERLCVGQSINMNWNTIEMGPLEPFTIERSEDGINWSPIITQVTGRAFTWRPKPEEISSDGVFMRIITERGHISSIPDRVKVDPRVSIEPLPTVVAACLGKRFVLETRATGVDIQYSWRRNGVALTQKGPGLVFDTVTLASPGRYECFVTGGCGQTVASSVVTITIPAVPTFTQKPVSIMVREGGAAELRATTSPLSQFVWFKVGTQGSVGIGAVLRFDSVRASDAGRYFCLASSQCDTVHSDTVYLTVQPVSVAEGALQNVRLILWPNPADSRIDLSLAISPVSISVINLRGEQVLFSAVVAKEEVGSVAIDVSSLQQGVYQAVVTSANGLWSSTRLVITR